MLLKKKRLRHHSKKSNLTSVFVILILVSLFILGGFWRYQSLNSKKASTQTNNQLQQNKQTTTTKTKNESTTKNEKQSNMRTPIDWQQSSETIPYPDLANTPNFWIKVSIKKNRTYLMSDNKVIYTMYSSAGAYHRDETTGKQVSYTPTGTFYIQAERGDTFFNNKLNEGANNWISWLNHGEYLFHSVPIDANGNYNLTAANKLGKQPDSHGCIRLSVPDSQWMCQNLKVGTKVVISDN